MNTFFTADTHFGHANIIRYCKRPQLQLTDVVIDTEGNEQWVSRELARQRAAEMDGMLIDNWNKTLTSEDDICHLGDYCFGSVDYAIRYLCRLKFRALYFIWGNHDSAMKEVQRAIKVGQIAPNLAKRIVFLGDLREITVNGQRITLCHYKMQVWNKSHHRAWHLFGHSHGTLPDDSHALSLDVGVDIHNYRPISFDEVKALMSKKTFVPIDHHGEN
jgi:calcineurin-like phosphoesterase family protein